MGSGAQESSRECSLPMVSEAQLIHHIVSRGHWDYRRLAR